MPAKGEKHYFAFISHSSKDEKMAFCLRDKLEKYHIPTVVQNDKTNEFKGRKRIKPCFVYQTDLAGRDLEQSLRKELFDSQYLVVLCSPESAKAFWVNKEIRKFVEADSADRIIPCIIRGEYEESMPDAIKELAEGKLYDEKSNTFKDVKAVVRRGVDFNKIEKDNKSKEAPVLNLIASMLGVRFDTIWDRYKRQRRRRMLTACIAFLLLVLLGLFLWDYNRPTYAYYEDYVDCWGKPEGIMPLTKEQAKLKHACCEFEYRRVRIGESGAYSWRLSKVRCKNADFSLGKVGKRYPLLEIEYIKGSNIVNRINYCTKSGAVLFTHKYSEHYGVPACIVDIENAQAELGVGFSDATIVGGKVYDEENDNRKKKPNIVRYVLERDERGRIIRQTYHSNNDYNLVRSSVCNADGIFGYKYQRDSLGRIILEEYLGWDGEKTCTHDGVSFKCFQYDTCGRMIKIAYYDLDDSLVYNNNLYCIGKAVYDNNGNVSEVSYWDANGLPCICSDGYHKIGCRYNEKGDAIEQSYFGVDGLPCYDKDGTHKIKVDYKHLRKGNEIKYSLYDIQDRPCNDYNGESVTVIIQDKKGNDIQKRFYNKDGVPSRERNGFFQVKSEYDNKNNLVHVQYFDEQGEPCKSNQTCFSIWTARYDKNNNQIEEAYFDENGRPVMYNGVAKWTAKYDERGNRIERSYYDTIGNLYLTDLGYATWRADFDEQGNVIQGAYYGVDGNLCVHVAGNSYNKSKYDAHGNSIEQCYYDKDGNLCMITSGFAKWTAKYDKFGNMIETACYNSDDSLCVGGEGFCIKRCKYDTRNRQIEELYFDTKGKPCCANSGCSKWVAKYDERGNRIEISCYGDDGKPILTQMGFRNTRSYDKYGRLVLDEYWDTNGKPYCNGYSKRTFIYHDEENYTEYFFIGADGETCVHDTVSNANARFVRTMISL